MDKAKDEAINKLITGQEKMGKDICALQIGQEKMGKDICALQVGQEKLNEDVSILKQDVSELKQDVSELKTSVGNLEVAFLKQLEIITNVQRVVINIENDLRPRVSTLFDADKTRQTDIMAIRETSETHETKLDDHEIRIRRLENT